MHHSLRQRHRSPGPVTVRFTQAVLECDVERSQLLAEEAALLAQNKPTDGASSGAPSNGTERNGAASSTSAASADPDPASARLQEVYARLQEIDADGAPARAASILAGLSFDEAMQRRATKTFSGGASAACVIAQCYCCMHCRELHLQDDNVSQHTRGSTSRACVQGDTVRERLYIVLRARVGPLRMRISLA